MKKQLNENKQPPSEAVRPTEVELDAAFDTYDGCPTAQQDLIDHGLSREGKKERTHWMAAQFHPPATPQPAKAAQNKDALDLILNGSTLPVINAPKTAAPRYGMTSPSVNKAIAELERVKRQRDGLLAASKDALEVGTREALQALRDAIAAVEGRA